MTAGIFYFQNPSKNLDLSYSLLLSTGLFEDGLEGELSLQARFLNLLLKVFNKIRFLFPKKTKI